MTKKLALICLAVIIALPALWFGANAYNEYRVQNCSPKTIDTPQP